MNEKVDELEQNANETCKYEVDFEKGKWVKLPGDDAHAYKLLELVDDTLIVTRWFRRFNPEYGRYTIECKEKDTLPKICLMNFIEIDKPDWVKD